MLTAAKVRNETRPGVYTDGPGRYGLTLTVKTGSYGIRKVWTQRLTVNGKRTMIGLGKVEFVTLAEARTMAFENARSVAKGDGPAHGGTRRRDARAARTVPTFAEAADSYIALQRVTWKPGSRNESNWRSSLAHAGALEAMPVDTIGTDDVRGVVMDLLRAGKVPTARSVRQRIRVILDWSIASGYRSGPNPANGELDAVMPRANHRTEHRASIEHGNVAEVLAKVEAIDTPTWTGLKGAFRFMVLTAARTSEVIGAKWSEIDLETRTWTVPAARMKANRDHRVPLNDAALSVLYAARERYGTSGLVFRSPRGGKLDDAALRRVMKRIGSDATPHGFRGTFKTWCMEKDIPRAVAEMSLAHSFMEDKKRAYVRTDLLEQRRPVMERWGAHAAP